MNYTKKEKGEMEEKELTDEQDNLLIEFDGYGFSPTITMPNAEEYAIEWKKRLIRVFDGQNAEIERLTELQSRGAYRVAELGIKNAELQKQVDEWKLKSQELEESWEIASSNEVKLQKQVDELKKWLDMKEHYIGIVENKLKQAVKDTVKEIWEKANKDFVGFDKISLKRLKQIVKDKGVEVE